MPDPQSAKQCGFHGPSPLVVSEMDLRKAVADAVTAELALWRTGGVLREEDNDARFADLVGYWLAGMDSSIRSDWLQSLKTAAGKTTYGNLTDTQLNADIQAFNAADTVFETANDTVYTRSGEVDQAKAALTPLESAAATAIARAKNAKRMFDRAKSVRPKDQSAATAAQTALTAAEQDRHTKVALRDSARSVLATKSSELKQARADVATARTTRIGLMKAAENWTVADRETARQDLFRQSSIALPKRIEAAVHAALAAAHNSRADTEAWSAAFVGASVRTAAMKLGLEGVTGDTPHGKDSLLKVSRRHSSYIVDVRDNAKPGRYQAFEPGKRAVQVGDIICTDRADFITKVERQTLKGLAAGTLLHGDIVVLVRSCANGFAQTIGGNVGQTVRQRRYPIDNDGKLIVREKVLIDQENDSGKFAKGALLGEFVTLPAVPTMVDRRSSFRIFALLSPVEKCKAAPKTSREMFDLESPFLDETALASEPAEVTSTAVEASLLKSPFLVRVLQTSDGEDDWS